MKILNTLKDMHKYSQYCAFCRESDRYVAPTLQGSYGYSLPYELVSSTETHLNLSGDVYHPQFGTYKSNLQLNWNTNSFAWSLPDEQLKDIKFKQSLVMTGDCFNCQRSYCTCRALLDFKTRTITDLEILRDGYRFLTGDGGFHVVLNYSAQKMHVSKLVPFEQSIIDQNIVISLPIIPLDFNDVSRTINRIKNMILYS